MSQFLTWDKQTNILVIISLALLPVNLLIIHFFDLFENRISRLSTIVLYLCLYLLLKGYKQKLLLAALILFVLGDVFLFFYETPLFSYLTLSSKSISYVLIILHLFSKFKTISPNRAMIILAVFMSVLLVTLLMELEAAASNKGLFPNQNIFIYCYGICLIISTLLVSYYNLKYGSQQSLFFLFFILGFTVSDICAFIGYYFDEKSFYFVDRAWYILGLMFFLLYLKMSFKEEKKSLIEIW